LTGHATRMTQLQLLTTCLRLMQQSKKQLISTTNIQTKHLIVITGDHECGGLDNWISQLLAMLQLSKFLKYQTMSYDEFDDIVASWRENPDGSHTFQMALDKAQRSIWSWAMTAHRSYTSN
jgi:alkaline phosphatase